MREMGVDPQTNLEQTSKNLEIIKECENSVLAAKELIRLTAFSKSQNWPAGPWMEQSF